MIKWLKWLVAGKEMHQLEIYRVTLDENIRFFSVIPEISLVLDNIRIYAEGEDWRSGDVIPCSPFTLRGKILQMKKEELAALNKRLLDAIDNRARVVRKDEKEDQLPLFEEAEPLTIHLPQAATNEYLIILPNGKRCNVKNLIDASSITDDEVFKYFENGITPSAVATVMTFIRKYTAANQQPIQAKENGKTT